MCISLSFFLSLEDEDGRNFMLQNLLLLATNSSDDQLSSRSVGSFKPVLFLTRCYSSILTGSDQVKKKPKKIARFWNRRHYSSTCSWPNENAQLKNTLRFRPPVAPRRYFRLACGISVLFAGLTSRRPGLLDIHLVRWNPPFFSSCVKPTTWSLVLATSSNEPRDLST